MLNNRLLRDLVRTTIEIDREAAAAVVRIRANPPVRSRRSNNRLIAGNVPITLMAKRYVYIDNIFILQSNSFLMHNAPHDSC
jgi:hypothetical protein